MFADNYFKKYHSYPVSILVEPQPDLKIIVVIPCYNEPDLIQSLESLYLCDKPTCAVEVIVVINSSESTVPEILEQNLKTYQEAIDWSGGHSSDKLNFHILHTPGLKKKDAGVGLARKIGMDAALSRFDKINKPDGIIVGYDADSLCDKNYFTEIENHFTKNQQSIAASIYFEHPVSGNVFSEKIYRGIIEYELHLRYFVQALRYCNFPYAFHTIGSSFAVRASVYMKQGGMNKKQAGEDFYFLHKVIPLENYGEINSTRVIPSPRPSDRVPFGTGAAIEKWIDRGDVNYYTYNLQSFADFSSFFSLVILLFRKHESEICETYKLIPESFKMFISQEEFILKIQECNSNSTIQNNYLKRIFTWFDAFKIIRFLNTLHENYYQKKPVTEEASALLKNFSILNSTSDTMSLLQLYRDLDRGLFKS